MRKEVIYAVIGGIILGLVVAFGVWRINSSIPKNKNQDINTQSPTPKSSTPGEFKIVLDKPENDDVVTTDTVNVSGLTKPLSWITVAGDESDYIIQSDTNGVFSQEVDLTPGVNQIKVTAFYPEGGTNGVKPSVTEVLVVYSSSFQTRTLPTDAPTKSEASGTSDIRAKVAQDVANTINRPKAYIGTVTDITDSTLEIKTMNSEIKQISVNSESTDVINAKGTTNKQVKVADIAIGDFIVAMGYINGNSVLAAQRILITDPVTEPKVSVSQAKVATVATKTLTVNTIPDNTEETIQPNSKTDIMAVEKEKVSIAKLVNIQKDDVIIYVTTIDIKGNLSVRTIFVVS
jgi:hypothetical protein